MTRVQKKEEKTEEKGLVAKLAAWGPVIAMVIAMIGACYTAYDRLVVQPVVERQARLNADLTAIRLARTEAQTKSLGKTDPIYLSQIQMALSAQEAAYAFRAIDDVRGLESHLNTEEWYTLATAEFDQMRQAEAMQFMDNAILSATDTSSRIGLMRIKADWLIRLSGTANYSDAQKLVSIAYVEAGKLTSPMADVMKAQLLAQRAVYGFQTKHCDDFTKAWSEFLSAEKPLEDSNVVNRAVRSSLSAVLVPPDNCAFDQTSLL